MFKFDYRNFTERVCYFKNTLLKELTQKCKHMSRIKIKVPDYKIKIFDDVEILDHEDKKESIMIMINF